MKKQAALFWAVVLGIVLGLLNNTLILSSAKLIGELFVRLLQLISLPVISLSIISTLANLESAKNFAFLSRKVVFYTLLTTILASTTALGLYEWLRPAERVMLTHAEASVPVAQESYLKYALQVIPDNFVQPYTSGNVVGIVFISILLGTAIFYLDEKDREMPKKLFNGLFLAILQITKWIIRWIPLAILCFIVSLTSEFRNGKVEIGDLGRYLCTIAGSNLLQAFIVLPVILKLHGLSPIESARGMFRALSVAFFSKSSAATMPATLQCIENNLKVSTKVSRFSIPLCTTINMNGCASFILVTVLFVAQLHGVAFSWMDKILWIFISTMAAVGNAGVPMGCFFLSTALLTAMNVPVDYMGLILPFYAFLDMIETSVNVWSDACVTLIVNKAQLKDPNAIS